MNPAFLRRLLPMIAFACVACSDRIVESRAYSEGKLSWSTVMPSSRNTALWLRYSVSGPVYRPDREAEGKLQYDFIGGLNIMGDTGPIYQGAVYLKPEGAVLDKTYSKGVRKDVEQSCTYSTCIETGRSKLRQLHEVPAGTLMEITGNLPLKHMGAELNSASLELAAN